MKAKILFAIFCMLILLAVSCNQDPIFYIISTETAPRKPRIEGAPTNMVIFPRVYPDRAEPVPIMFVASGRLHWYAKGAGADEPRWDSPEYAVKQPLGKIISLAIAGDRLYALCRDGSGINSKLRYITTTTGADEEWITIDAPYADIQAIYADPQSTRLFAAAGRNTYSILYLDNGIDTFNLIKSNVSILSGVICREEVVYIEEVVVSEEDEDEGASEEETESEDEEDVEGEEEVEGEEVEVENEEKIIEIIHTAKFYYLSTKGDGIFRISEEGAIQQLEDNSDLEEKDLRINRTFMSMIKLDDDTIIAVERNGGNLYEVRNGSFARIRYTIPGNNNWMATGKYATEAITTWHEYPDGGGENLLVVGLQGGLYSTTTSSYTYGYVEFELNDDGSLNTGVAGRSPSKSVDNTDRYTATLGKHPINRLLQAPAAIDPNRTFFASTQTVGLWSYRDRPSNGGWQWNAEE